MFRFISGLTSSQSNRVRSQLKRQLSFFDYQQLENRQLLAADVLAVSADGAWNHLEPSAVNDFSGTNYIQATSYNLYDAQEQQLLNTLDQAPMEFTPAADNPVVLTVPTPDGGFERFAIVEAPVMAPELAAQFPDINTYRGQGIDNPAATIRLDYTMHGFHAQVLAPGGRYYVDPYYHLETDLYMSYYASDAIRNADNAAAFYEALVDDGEIIYEDGVRNARPVYTVPVPDPRVTVTSGAHTHSHAGHTHTHDHSHDHNHDHPDVLQINTVIAHDHDGDGIPDHAAEDHDSDCNCGDCASARADSANYQTVGEELVASNAEDHDSDCNCADCTAARSGASQQSLNASNDPGTGVEDPVDPGPGSQNAAPYGDTLRTFDTAIAATGEYTQFHGGTVAAGQAAIVTALNRVTGIYETEVAVRMVLVANNSSIVYTNGNTDPYTNNNGFSMLSQNQSNLDSVIGNANYDLGHVFSTGGGGIAGLGVVGQTGAKAQGVTGLPSPIGDPFYVDFVAHEMGHQYGGTHTFNGNSGSCSGGNRTASTAYEPGSGSTIQAYAGICGNDNLQNNSDAMFHSASIDQIRTEVTTGSGNAAATVTNTGNQIPTVDAGGNFVIPDQTPFELTAVGSDPDGNGSLTYSWEQRDLGPQRDVNASDNGSSPIFRSWLPTSDPTRVFPRMQDIIDGNTVVGEQYPTTNWNNMDFRVVLRDNNAGGGGVVSDDMSVQIVNSGSGFDVTSQSTATSWTGLDTETVTWNVAGTTGNGINTANVDIYFSLDRFNYDIMLASGVPNDGSHDIVVPNVDTSTGRIKVKGSGNIFFDINEADITVVTVDPPAGGIIGETGLITGLTHITQNITFNNTYTDPVVVIGPSTDNGADPLVPLVTSVTSTGFDIAIDEWDYLNGLHNAAEDFSFIVVESGTHTLTDGTVIEAGYSNINANWTSVNLASSFSGSPVVLAQNSTANGPEAVTTRIRNVSNSGFDLRLQEEQAGDQVHSNETVGWIAVEQGPGSAGTTSFIAGLTPDAVTHSNYSLAYGTTFGSAPAFIAQMQTYDGADPATIRSRSIGTSSAVVFIEEETSADAELNHTTEVVGFVAFDIGNLEIVTPASDPGEAGIASGVTDVWQTVNLTQSYANPVVVAGPLTDNDVAPAVAWVRNVTSSSFEIRVAEWNYLDGIHTFGEEIGYVVMEAGRYQLPDGTLIEAGNSSSDHNWSTVNYSSGFANTPVVLSQNVSENGSDVVTTRHRNVSNSSFEIRLQEEQGNNGTHISEDISWLAIEIGNGSSGGLVYEANRTGQSVTDSDFTQNFVTPFSSAPVFLASMQTFAGADPAATRARSLSLASATFFLQEETSADAETSHIAENIGYFALQPGLIPGTSSSPRPFGRSLPAQPYYRADDPARGETDYSYLGNNLAVLESGRDNVVLTTMEDEFVDEKTELAQLTGAILNDIELDVDFAEIFAGEQNETEESLENWLASS